MDNEGNADASSSQGNAGNTEQIETSVVVMDSEMIIVQPDDLNQPVNQIVPVLVSIQNAVPQPQLQPIAPDNDVQGENVDSSNDNNLTPTSKKRKRSLPKHSPKPIIIEPLNDEDDEGSTCSICLDTWEWDGKHRLVALKCGHLFGDSCIRRWIQECPTHAKCCPTCKKKATPRDIRIIYAKRVVQTDKSEEERLSKLVVEETEKRQTLQGQLSTLMLEMAVLSEKYTRLEAKIAQYGMKEQPQTSTRRESIYKLSLDKNIELNRQGGCRAMTYGQRNQTLIVSQKSAMSLFPGFGVRFINAYNLQPTVFFRIAPKPIRDLSLDFDEQLLAAAAMEKSAFIHSCTNHVAVATVTPCDSQIWAASFDKTRQRCLHVGSQHGVTYVYDIRNCMNYLETWSTPGDASPVCNIVAISSTNDFPFGGFIVCKLQSLWFYEYTNSQNTEQTKLQVEGPFVSINYDEQTKLLLIATRPNSKYPQSRYIVGQITKIDRVTVFRIACTVMGAKSAAVMSRCTQIHLENDTLLAAYLQDSKLLTTWNSETGSKIQAFNVDDCILDMCSMKVNNRSYLATLSESKCRIFQINKV